MNRHLKLILLAPWFLSLTLTLTLTFSFPFFALAQDSVSSNQERFGTDQPRKRYMEAKEAVEQAKSNKDLGLAVGKKYGSRGSEFDPGKGQFKENPLKYANAWQGIWRADEEIIKEIGQKEGMDLLSHTCAAWHEIAPLKPVCEQLVNVYIMANFPSFQLLSCDQGRHDGGSAGAQMWEFWRAENEYEANNFAISQVMNIAGLHPLFATLKDANMLSGFGSLSGQAPALSALLQRGGDTRPGGLKAPPHIGQSHFEGSGALPFEGQYNQFEVGVTRTRHDAQRSIDYEGGDKYSYLRECMPPTLEKDITNAMFTKKKRFAFFRSERIPDLWRLPELSKVRYEGASAPYKQLYGKLADLALQVGRDYHGDKMSPLKGGMPSSAGPKVNTMDVNSLCASYWLSDIARWNAFGEGEFPLDKTFQGKIKPAIQSKEDWKKLCYHPGLGTLYPLIGTVPTDSNVLAPLMAIRRFMDWTSWEGIDRSEGGGGVDRKTNYMDDTAGGIYKNWNDAPFVGTLLPDKLQRLSPSPTGCFGMQDVHPRNKALFNPSISSPDGSWRYAHWNLRQACVCSAGRMWIPGVLSSIVPIPRPVCIPVQE